MTRSWDLFDTLIGRKCGTAERLWEQLAHDAGDAQFPKRRRSAEAFLQKRGGEYTLADIYQAYAGQFQDRRAKDYQRREWELELSNAFPIRRNVEQLEPQDILVSDMYLAQEQLQALLEAAGISFRGTIYASCYGKHTGKIWAKVLAEHQIASHCGDHLYNDIERPRKLGIVTRDAGTALSPDEVIYCAASPALGWWIRQHRLQQVADETKQKLDLLAIEYNAPFLLAASQVLVEQARKDGAKRLLFMSRDGQMFQQLWQKLHPEIASEYLYISRECLRDGSESYYRYLNARLTDDAELVDLAASGGSLKAALPKLTVNAPRLWAAVFLESWGVEVSPIRLAYGTTNVATRINNTALEMLNYGTHWHVADVDEQGQPQFDQPNEYDMALVEGYHRAIEKMIDNAPTVPVAHPGEVLCYALERIHENYDFLKATFPGHIKLERKRRKKLEAA